MESRKNSEKALPQIRNIWSIFILLSCLAISLPSISGMKCHVLVKVSDDLFKQVDDCDKSNKADYSKRPPFNSSVEDFDFDDNCNEQCLYKGMGLITAEGTLKKDGAKDFFKGSDLDNDVWDGLNTIWNTCLEKANTIGKSKGFTDCKICTLHGFCLGKTFRNDKTLERKCC